MIAIDFICRDFSASVFRADTFAAVKIEKKEDTQDRVAIYVYTIEEAERAAGAFIEAANYFRAKADAAHDEALAVENERGLVAVDEGGLNEQAEEARLAALAAEPSELERILHNVRSADGEPFL